jgi:hypothetical protein
MVNSVGDEAKAPLRRLAAGATLGQMTVSSNAIMLFNGRA